MDTQIFRLQHNIGSVLLDKLERQEISVERAKEISQMVLGVIAEDANDAALPQILPKIQQIPELQSLDLSV